MNLSKLKFWNKPATTLYEPDIDARVLGIVVGGQVALFDADAPKELKRFLYNGSSSTLWGQVERKTFKNPTVLGCLRLLGGAIAQANWKVYVEDAKGYKRSYNAQLERLLNVSPSELWSAPQFWEMIVREIYLHGQSIVKIEAPMVTAEGRREPTRLRPLRPEHVTVHKHRNNPNEVYYMYSPEIGDRQVFGSREVLHFTSQLFEPPNGVSPFISIATPLAIAELMEQFSYYTWKGGNTSNFVVTSENPKKMLTQEILNNIDKGFAKRMEKGYPDVLRPIALAGEIRITPISITPNEAAILSQKEYFIEEVLRCMGIPSYLLNLQQRSTTWGSGLVQIGAMFKTFTIGPLVARLEAELTRKLFPQRTKYRVKLETDALMEQSFTEMSNALRVLLGGQSNGGVISTNEARAKLRLDPLDGDEYERVYLPADVNTVVKNSEQPEQLEQLEQEIPDEEQREQEARPQV